MNEKAGVRYSAKFYKKGDLVYISHLDLMRLFRRAIRRADLPFVLTGGFTPRVKISMPRALKLGKESDSEEFEFWLVEEREPAALKEALNGELPEGVKITELNKR